MTTLQTRFDPTAALLDERILDAIHRWQTRGESLDDAAFSTLALDIFRYQVRNCAPYGRFATARGFTPAAPPQHWTEIPAVPSGAFKELALATFDVQTAERTFYTSGTTSDKPGKHFLQRAYLYDESLLAGFDRFMLPDRPSLRYLNVVPNPRTNKHSSLGYMLGHVSVLRGDGKAGWFFEGDRVDVAGFQSALESAIAVNQPVCIAGTAFALAALLMTLAQDAVHLHAPAGSRIMETGGFKGRAQRVDRSDLYARLEHAFGIPQNAIVAEYGMTELCSQYYDTLESRKSQTRVKAGPPWLRTTIVDEVGNPAPAGQQGYLRHFDLANRSSILAIDTEDRGHAIDGGFVLLGREDGAPPRGCSLDAEDLIAGR